MHEFPIYITTWLTQYGSLALFVLLALGVIAMPIPDETLIVLSGIFVAKGKLDLAPTLLAAYTGAMCGITTSYVVGRLAGKYFLHKYGKWIGITEEKLQKVHIWFERFGRWLLVFGYFIPGIRHLTGYAAGMTEMEYKHFAVFAYSGAVLWVSALLTIGYFIGDRWFLIEEIVNEYWHYAIVICVLLIVIYLFYYFYKKRSR